jgi:hypothetical protein
MLVNRNDYVAEFMTDALKTTIQLLEGSLPGQLLEFSLRRDENQDSVLVRLVTNKHPDVEFVYEYAIFDVNVEPQYSAHTDVSIFFGALLERVQRWAPPAGKHAEGLVRL